MQITVVVPIANVDPDDGVQVTGTLAPYSSVAVGAVQVTAAPDVPAAVATMSAGIPMTVGRVVPALTVTLKDDVLAFP